MLRRIVIQSVSSLISQSVSQSVSWWVGLASSCCSTVHALIISVPTLQTFQSRAPYWKRVEKFFAFASRLASQQTHQRPSDSACAGVRDGDGDNGEDRDRAVDIAALWQSGNGALTMAVSSKNCFEHAQWLELEAIWRNEKKKHYKIIFRYGQHVCVMS